MRRRTNLRMIRIPTFICSCWFILLLLHKSSRVEGFQQISHHLHSIVLPYSTTSIQAFKWPTLPTFTPDFPQTTNDDKKASIGERNGIDPDYPWRFEGRFIFRPSLVRISNDDDAIQPPQSVNLLSLFGYSLGGSVVLEYDVSPVGPYREYVTMGGVVGLGKVNIGDDDININKRTLGIGQWGTNLYVSTQVAEDVCQYVWGVPAQVADIEFLESGDTLADGPDDDSEKKKMNNNRKSFVLSGWDNARILDESNVLSSNRYGNIPIYWTPTIKALWAPILLPGISNDEQEQLLPLHKLRLSASAIRLKRCQRIQSTKEGDEVPLGLALVVDNVLIEIGERITSDKSL